MRVLQDRAERLINQQCHTGGRHTLNDIDRRHRKAYERRNIMNIAIDLRTCRNNRLHGHSEQCGKCRKQIYPVKCRSKYRHDHGTGYTGQECSFPRLLKHVDDRCRQNQTASDHKISKITHECGTGSLDHQFKQNLAEFNHHACHRSKREGTYQCRNLTEIQFIESGCQKRNRKIKYM